MNNWTKDFFLSIDKIEKHVGPWLFYMSLVLTFVTTIFFSNKDIPASIISFSKQIRAIIPWICYFRLVLLLPNHYKYVIKSAAVLILCYVCWHCSGQKTLLNSALLLVASRGADIRCSLSIFGVMISGILVFALVSFCWGITGDVTTHSLGLVGHSLGTVNPNTFSCFLLMLTEIGLLLGDNKSIKLVFILCWGIGLLTWIITLCSTTSIILVFFPILYYRISKIRISSYVYASVPWVLLLISIVLMLAYGPSSGESTFESRFSMPAIAFEKYGLSWFGQYCGQIGAVKAKELGIEPFFIDNMYLRLLLYFGIIPGLFVMFFQSHLLVRISHFQEPMILTVALCLCLIGVMEAYPLFAFNNIAFLYYLAKDNTIKEAPSV